jgi:peptidoglycan/LPS O-acetylase OafA/YrhL
MRAQVNRLETLTGLRFLAAAAVVFTHTQSLGFLELVGLPGLAERVPLGGAGVTFFFVLSGFILTYVYPRLATAGEVGRFLLARFARLWPANLVGLVASMVAFDCLFWPDPQVAFPPLTRLLVHAAMLESWYPSFQMVMCYNAPAWSISAEFGFYLFFIPLIWNWSRSWWWKLPLTLAAPLALVAVAAARGWTTAVPPGHVNYEIALYFTPVMRLWQFAVGMAAALAWQRLCRGRRVGLAAGTALELAAAGLAVAACLLSADAGRAAAAVPWLGPPASYFVYQCGGLTVVPFALLIVTFANRWGLASWPFATAPAVFLGEISFGVYILHFPLMIYFTSHILEYRGLPRWALFAGYWAILLGASAWLYATVERPARRWIVGRWPAGGFAGPRAAAAALARSPAAWWTGGTLALLGLVLAFALRAHEATFRFLNRDRVAREIKFAPPATRDVRFGDDFLLRGATLHRVPGGIELRAVWESLRLQPPGFKVWVQGLESAYASGEGIWTIYCWPPMLAGPVQAGWVWEHRVFIPQDKLDAAPQVVMVVLNKGETGLLPVYGPFPENPYRLRVIPTPVLPAPADGVAINTPKR